MPRSTESEGQTTVTLRATSIVHARRLESPVVDAVRGDGGVRVHRLTTRQFERGARALAGHGAEELDVDEDLRPEPERLRMDAGGEVRAADAVREARVVLDSRARACLPARRERLDHERPEPLGRSVEGRCQTRGAGAEDRDVVARAEGAWANPVRVASSCLNSLVSRYACCSAADTVGTAPCPVAGMNRLRMNRAGRFQDRAVIEQRAREADVFERAVG